jgi:hypothetical protein
VTATQLLSLSLEQIAYFGTKTPIVLDLNGDGISTLSRSAGVQFDIAAGGARIGTGWVANTDGLLVMDRSGDGAINDGSELFGSATTLADGTKASDGYVALGELDANHDGVLNSQDDGFDSLQVWVDGNSDGVSTGGELKSLAELSITSISVVAERNISKDNGNIVGLTSSYQTADGASHQAADVWFMTDRASAPVVASAAKPVDLSGRVNELVQAMGQFDSAAPKVAAQSGLAQEVSASIAAATSPSVASVGSMVDLLKQFDANGKLMVNQSALGSAPATKLQVPSLGDAVTNGFLAAPGTAMK